MEEVNFNYSLKNIPTPTKTSYQLMLMEKIDSFIKRMRWKAHFYLKKDTSNIAYKKNTESCFDVTMGRFHGAEICELVGVHILSLLSYKLEKQSTGLYRDDELVLLRNTPKKKTDRIRKDIIQIFKNAGFKIKMKTNLHMVDFLDVTFNLLDGTYKPYKKPNGQLLYVKTSSNHPPQIIKQLLTSISNRLSNNSSNKQVFDMSKSEYEKALRERG